MSARNENLKTMSKMRVTTLSHRVRWKKFGFKYCNKAIFDFVQHVKHKRKVSIKMKKLNNAKCTSVCACEEKMKIVREIMNNSEFQSQLNKLTNEQKAYVDMLADNMRKKLHGEEFTMEEKLKCMSIYMKSLDTYEYLSTFLIFPKIVTIKKAMRAVYFDTGITTAMLNRMKEVARKKSDLDKVVVLMFSSVSLQQHLNYNEELDKILGFEDWGGGDRENKLADKALVFMIRGIYSEWSLPVAYSFYDENLRAFKLIKMYKEVVRAVKEAGFNIVASVCDRRDSEVSALEELRTETLEKTGSDTTESCRTILVHNVEIIPLFNPLDLLREFRNILFSKNLEFCVDSIERPPKWDYERELSIKKNKHRLIASWQHIEIAYRMDILSNESCRKMPKLMDLHIYEEELVKWETEFVTEVFTGSSAESIIKYLDVLSLEGSKIKTSGEKIQMPLEGYYTVYIVRFFKKLFEAMSGQKRDQEGKAVFTNNNFHYAFFEAAKEELRHMRFIDRKTQEPDDESNLYFENLISTVEGFQVLWKKMSKLGFEYLKTGDFDLKPLDDFAIKNMNLTCQRFSKNFKNYCYFDLVF